MWDKPVPADLDAKARHLLKEIIETGTITLPRALMEETTDFKDVKIL